LLFQWPLPELEVLLAPDPPLKPARLFELVLLSAVALLPDPEDDTLVTATYTFE